MTTARSNPYAELQLHAESTQKNHQLGAKIWNQFAEEQEVKKVEEWTIDDVENDDGVKFSTTFREFAQFLLEAKNRNGSNYACDVQLQYLSNAKNAFVRQFKNKNHRVPDMLTDTSPMADWYKELRVSVFLVVQNMPSYLM
jgi:hypothetical protein